MLNEHTWLILDWCSTDVRLIFDQQLTDIPPTVDRYIINSWPIYHWHMTDTWLRFIYEISTDTQLTVGCYIDRLSTSCRLIVDWLSTDCWLSVDWHIGRLLTDSRLMYRPTYRSRLPTVNLICFCCFWRLSKSIMYDNNMHYLNCESNYESLQHSSARAAKLRTMIF